MDIASILYPVAVIGGIGLLFGVGLGYAGVIFAVKADEKVGLIREALPGANCGGCGFAGCEAFAVAVSKGDAKTSGCPVGGSVCAEKISGIMGVKAEVTARVAAYNKCVGTCESAKENYNYFGLDDCRAVSMLTGSGGKACKYGCLGNGSCKRACMFDAIQMVDGIAVIDNKKCTACGMCVKTCPRSLIELVPYASKVRVGCNSNDNGKTVREVCSAGCIACKLCEKACQFDAIHVIDNLARIDYTKCVQCGVCVIKCPTKVIKVITE